MNNKLTWGFTGKEGKLSDLTNCVGAGWKSLVEVLVADLFNLGWDGVVMQVKEKFGGLRFYIGSGNDEIWERIQEAEETSFTVCEECGAPGKLVTVGWWKTACPTHGEHNNEYL